MAEHRLDPRQLGGLVGAVGGLVFVLVNAVAVPGAWTVPVRIAGVAAFVAVVVLLLRRPPVGTLPEPTARARRVYLACVAAMVLAVPLGAAVLRALDGADAVPAWVVLVVGLHFVPFASAFRVPLFGRLGLLLAAVALVGIVVELAGVDGAAGVAAVVAGFVLLGSAVAGSRLAGSRVSG